MLSFLRNIVFIFLPTVVQLNQVHHPKWKSLCCFCTYFHELMGTSFTLSELQTIERKQWRYLSVFIEAYGKEMVVPKFHFAGHMPFETWRYGPFRLLWCMRFEAKNQEHKRSAKLGDFKGVSKTVSEFWAMRSGLRLLGKRKRSSPMQDVNTAGTVTHSGMELSPGTWILLQDGASQIIARIDSFQAIDGIMYAKLRSFKVLAIMRRCENDMPYASVESLLSNSGAVQTLLAIHSAAITVLLPIEYKGRVRFVEQV